MAKPKSPAAKRNPLSRTVFSVPKNHLRIGECNEHYGGVFAGMMRGTKGKPDYYLFVPPEPAAEAKLAWGGYAIEEPNATCAHDGLANTIALRDSKVDHPAAEFCKSLELYGLSDYYLPSQQELKLCQINCPEVFAKEWYWSSTQFSANYAWVQSFYFGNRDFGRKDGEYRARAVRRLVIQ